MSDILKKMFVDSGFYNFLQSKKTIGNNYTHYSKLEVGPTVLSMCRFWHGDGRFQHGEHFQHAFNGNNTILSTHFHGFQSNENNCTFAVFQRCRCSAT